MIVVVSDFHLTDGASGTSVEPGAFAVFARLVGDMARHASHRGTRFRPLEEGLDLILLGDTLDLLRSSAWPPRRHPGERVPRPWEPPADVAPTVGRIVDRILEHNAPGLAILRALAEDGALFYEAGRIFRVPVRITYFVGNHDWLLHLPGTVYDAIRWRVVKAMGLSNSPGAPFPHDPAEADHGLAERLRRHRLVVRHGDVYDADSYAGDRNRSALGDGVVIELLNRLPDAVREELGLAEDDPLFRALREVDNVRPYILIPPWVLGVIRRFGLEGKPAGRALLDVWSRLSEEFFALDFVRARDRPWRWDEVDRLELKFRFLKGFVARRSVRAVIGRILPLLGDPHRRYAQHALEEPEIVRGEADYVAYGHTHVHEIVPLAARRGAGLARQFYLNSGSWRPLYRQTLADPERLEFLAFNNLTVLAFYSGDERGGRGFEVWNGALAGAS